MKKKVITICSSVSFYRDVVGIATRLETAGFSVKLPETARLMKQTGNFESDSYKPWLHNKNDYSQKTALMEAHFQKVLESDAILVVNQEKHGISGYIGGNVLMEMTLAYHYHKPIFLWNDLTSALGVEEEVRGLHPIIISQDVQLITF